MNALVGKWLMSAPVWSIGVTLFAGMLAAAWLGSWLRRRHRTSEPPENAKDAGHEGLVVSAVMGLLALLVGFIFSFALDRFDSRRTGVLEEANAIGTTYTCARSCLIPLIERG